MAQYTVLRAHWGEKDGKRHRFQPGKTREAVVTGEVEAMLRFKVLEPYLPQLDHDGDGSPGGSKPKSKG